MRREVTELRRRLDATPPPALPRGGDLRWERATCVETDEALAAVAQADEMIAEADRARDESLPRVKDAYRILRRHATRTRLPRDVP